MCSLIGFLYLFSCYIDTAYLKNIVLQLTERYSKIVLCSVVIYNFASRFSSAITFLSYERCVEESFYDTDMLILNINLDGVMSKIHEGLCDGSSEIPIL